MKKNVFMKIAIILKPTDAEEFASLVPKFIKHLTSTKRTVYFLNKEKQRVKSIFNTRKESIVKNIKFLSETLLFSKSDLIISMGGDGTLLGVCRNVNNSKIPIVGVNLGDLGFITEFNKDDLFKHIDNILDKNFNVNSQQMFIAKIIRKHKVIFNDVFFNDASVSRTEISRIIRLSLTCNKDHVFDTSGDGIIVSTPIGSTAYSLSAGGPIVHPTTKSILLTPICPHSLTHRPIVIPENSKIEIKILPNTESAMLTLDGQIVRSITPEDKIIVTRAPKSTVKLILNPDRNYFQTLKDKFIHGRRYIQK